MFNRDVYFFMLLIYADNDACLLLIILMMSADALNDHVCSCHDARDEMMREARKRSPAVYDAALTILLIFIFSLSFILSLLLF